MSWLSKAIKRNKKHITKLVQKGASVATGGLSDKAIAIAKSGAKLVKGAKAKRTLDRIPKPQLDAIRLKSKVPTAATRIDNTAVAMPGGARIAGAAAPWLGKGKRRTAKQIEAAEAKAYGLTVQRPKSSKVPKATKAKAKKAPKVKAKRSPPKGGIDLKALSAAWKAQGKPGKWIDFVKANSKRAA